MIFFFNSFQHFIIVLPKANYERERERERERGNIQHSVK